jgi:hypothetical protein
MASTPIFARFFGMAASIREVVDFDMIGRLCVRTEDPLSFAFHNFPTLPVKLPSQGRGRSCSSEEGEASVQFAI